MGVRGGSLEPPFGLQKILYTPLCILSALPFEIGPLVLLLLRITAVQMSVMQLCEFVHGRPAWNARVTVYVGVRVMKGRM